MSGVALVPRIFVDESGDLGRTKDAVVQASPFYVVSFVYVRDPSALRKRLGRFLKKAHRRGWYPPELRELKFYLPRKQLYAHGYTPREVQDRYLSKEDMVRARALHVVADHVDGVFVAVLDKRKAEPDWRSIELGNFVFAQTLVVNVLNGLAPPVCPLVVYDKGRLSPTNTAKFLDYIRNKDSYFGTRGLKRYQGNIPTPVDESSENEPGLWAADLAAGAHFHKYQHREPRFANILTSKRIGPGERLYWP